MSAAPQVIQQITNAPLPFMLEKLGASIANAQAALDANSIRLANEMATIKIGVGDEEHNLISLGFAPTFYAFTEASFEVKMEFSVAESESYGGSLGFNYGNSSNSNTNTNASANNANNSFSANNDSTETQMFGISISAHYARKFSVSAEASSSIAAKIVSLPAPDVYYEILKSTITKDK
ncbi:hypothetical protein [Tenacibaculum soleae]|uniref:Uncharacterized protein n=1 Tax=Tenacibaculum soleae TaxID=447689 RepID=A0A1B9XYJ7_9FLAO|nr:hypothetical protein [Tenacibaculum soleae]MDO6812293.1 hypothetical protein [Tenacibaculum soleae]OCK42609.1 hypothetical protein BA195_10575 [Tenacibaculum soleae]